MNRKKCIFTFCALVLLTALSFGRNRVWDSDLSLCRDTLAKSPEKARVNNNCGLAYESAGRDDLAVSAYLRTVDLNPDYSAAHSNLGLQYARSGQLERAREEFRTALRQMPAYAVKKYRFGRTFDSDEAVARAADAFARFNLALRFRDQGLNEKAIEQFRLALLAVPDYADVHLNLGIAYGEQGRIDDAVRHLEAASAGRPDDAVIRHNLETAYRIKTRSRR